MSSRKDGEASSRRNGEPNPPSSSRSLSSLQSLQVTGPLMSNKPRSHALGQLWGELASQEQFSFRHCFLELRPRWTSKGPILLLLGPSAPSTLGKRVTHTHIHIHTHTYTPRHIHIHTHYTHIYTYTHIHTYTHTHIHTHTTHIHTYTHAHTHIYTYTHIHIYTHTHTLHT